MDTTILTEPAPASPGLPPYTDMTGFTGAYLPGILPGAAASQYGAPAEVPGGPVVSWGPMRTTTQPGAPLDRGSGTISGNVTGWDNMPTGIPIHGNADGT